MIDPTIIDALVAAGCTAEQLAAAMKADAAIESAKIEAKKAKGRARFQRWKETHSNGDKRSQTLAADSNVLTSERAPVEDKTSSSEIEPQESKNSTPASPSPREHLETVLDAEHADAVLQHRKSIKAPLTQRSAKLLAKELGKCPDPNAAADTMMLRGWRGFEASWLANPPRTGPPGRTNPTLVAARNLMDQLNAVTPSEIEGHQPSPRLVAIGGRGG